jgi:hypothetical protein
MAEMASEEKEAADKIEKFINDILNYIASLDPINNVEKI